MPGVTSLRLLQAKQPVAALTEHPLHESSSLAGERVRAPSAHDSAAGQIRERVVIVGANRVSECLEQLRIGFADRSL